MAYFHQGNEALVQSVAICRMQHPSSILLAGVNAHLPWIMLMPGFNCYASDYTSIQHLLAGKGYLVAIADMFHPLISVARNLSIAQALSRKPPCWSLHLLTPQ